MYDILYNILHNNLVLSSIIGFLTSFYAGLIILKIIEFSSFKKDLFLKCMSCFVEDNGFFKISPLRIVEFADLNLGRHFYNHSLLYLGHKPAADAVLKILDELKNLTDICATNSGINPKNINYSNIITIPFPIVDIKDIHKRLLEIKPNRWVYVRLFKWYSVNELRKNITKSIYKVFKK